MRRWLVGLAAVSLLGVAVGVYLALSRVQEADATDPALVGLGQTVYRQHCASCHGARMEGQPNWQERRADGRLPAPPHDETGHTWHHSDRQLFAITKRGVAGIVPGYQSDMPAYADIISDREIWAALAYIKSSWPAAIRARQPRNAGSN